MIEAPTLRKRPQLQPGMAPRNVSALPLPLPRQAPEGILAFYRSLPNPRPAAASPPPPPRSMKKPGALSKDDPAGLAAILANSLSRTLTYQEKKRCALVDQIFKNQTPKVNHDLLSVISGQAETLYRHYYALPVTLWPSHRAPCDILQAWHYVAHALRNNSQISTDPLLTTVSWPEVDRLVNPWLREESLKHWQEQLSTFSAARSFSAPPCPAFRLRLIPQGAQIDWLPPGAAVWTPIKATPLRQHARVAYSYNPAAESLILDEDSARFLRIVCPQDYYQAKPLLEIGSALYGSALNNLIRTQSAKIVDSAGQALLCSQESANWSLLGPCRSPLDSASDLDPAAALNGDYILAVSGADGQPIADVVAILPGQPNLVLTPNAAYPLPGPPLPATFPSPGSRIPVAAVESHVGLAALDRLGVSPPSRLARRVTTVKVAVRIRCQYLASRDGDVFQVCALASCGGLFPDEEWIADHWSPRFRSHSREASAAPSDTLTRIDRSLQIPAGDWLALANLSSSALNHSSAEFWLERRLSKTSSKLFPDQFLAWLEQRPEGVSVELDRELAALRDLGKVTAQFHIELEPAGIDWFDLELNLQLSDITLTPQDVDLLLANNGSWVRLPKHGWRKIELNATEETHRELADLGLSAGDVYSAEKQRLHVLQLAHPAASTLLPAETVGEVRRRASELRTSVAPTLPRGITATLRNYQLEGFHFLAYLSTNHFGGILADDMGLGKTIQALTWMAWLHETDQLGASPMLVVCPKSVQDNWTSEAAKFYPALPVHQWTSATVGDLAPISPPAPPAPKSSRAKKTASAKKASASPPPLLIINYTQLRLHAEAISAITWSTVVLDEAQYIKNPTSVTAKTACALRSRHRLALSGTPIENRLLDLWSIMAFAMPGILHNRTSFAKNFGAKDDPLARRRLGARVRPFLLRRTKKEVAADLPDRIEEDLICELEGPQRDHYMAELKHARSTLLKAKTAAQLDKLRFNILTSLLRLRQICCHPSLTGKGQPDANSAKLDALLELLEPLVEEGHKVLIFSQFVAMLHLIGDHLAERQWAHSTLTGATEDRGALVRQFQESEGAHVFLISLKAGGSGLNLTAASYVVLFDPWWNPAVENQAIDRTHRIGQVQKVIAYRLITRDTIEEKIRHLQKAKSALASDILGEETFAKALTLDDFQFLLGS